MEPDSKFDVCGKRKREVRCPRKVLGPPNKGPHTKRLKPQKFIVLVLEAPSLKSRFW
jgi:hypothetical protein